MTHTDSPTCPLASCEIAHKSGSMASKRHAAQAAQMAAFDGQRPRCSYGSGCRRTVAFHHIAKDFEGETIERRPVCAVDAPFLNGGILEPVGADEPVDTGACVECGGISAHDVLCTANEVKPDDSDLPYVAEGQDVFGALDEQYTAVDGFGTAAVTGSCGPVL